MSPATPRATTVLDLVRTSVIGATVTEFSVRIQQAPTAFLSPTASRLLSISKVCAPAAPMMATTTKQMSHSASIVTAAANDARISPPIGAPSASLPKFYLRVSVYRNALIKKSFQSSMAF